MPYPNEVDATGISFQVNHGKHTKSLLHINDAIKEINGKGIDADLNSLIEQGVLFLNSSLTFTKDIKNFDLWLPFIVQVIKAIDSLDHNVLYVLLGKQAQSLGQHIHWKQEVIEAEHPVAASYNNRKWQHNDVFRKMQNSQNIII